MAIATWARIHRSMLKYDFHVFVFGVFSLFCYDLDSYFKTGQHPLITEKYWAAPHSYIFWSQTAFILLCYASEILVLWKAKLKRYFILLLLSLDILALFAGTLIYILCTKSGLANIAAPGNLLIALLLVALKDWLIISAAGKRSGITIDQ